MASPQPNLRATRTAFPPAFWLSLAAGALATGVTAGLLMRLLRAVQDLAWNEAAHANFLQAVMAASWPHRVLVLIMAGIVVALGRGLLRRATGGHGAGVDEAIWFEDGALPFWHTAMQAILSICVVALGASLGREAAPKQMGALFGGLFARWASLSPSHARLLAACGTGAGVAAVYNVPFGGALFALEVMLGTLSLPLIPPALMMTGLATLSAWLLLPTRPTYEVPAYPLSASLIVWALLAGPLAGLASVGYTRLISWSDTLKPRSRVAFWATPVVVFAGLGLLALPLPQLLGNGKDDVQLALLGQLTLPVLLGLVILKPVATAACLGSGAPGGLFTPTLSVGAALGGTLGGVWLAFWPGAPVGAYAVVGLASVLAATTLGPVSAVVMVLELAHQTEALIVPVILAAGGAVIVAWTLDGRSVYSSRVHRGRRHAETASAPTVSAAARHAELLHAILRQGPGGGPVQVVDHTGRLIGTVSPERAREPLASDGPLETATARDFVDRRFPG